ncbi:MAG TPA: SAM-dependent methyltransferase [Selenomonadales bacterium]|nr:SAM-dependent methyltransferase [Selenomonadales bacterium]
MQAVKRAIKKQLLYFRAKTTKNIKLIIGSGGIKYDGWIPTDIDTLNVLNRDEWEYYFKPGTISALLAEHVWEHFTSDDAHSAAQLCYDYVKPGGYLRVAVPDGLHPDAEYINYVRPGGIGWGSDDHKALYTYKTLAEIFEKAGFRVNLLEYFDENGQFQNTEWSLTDGIVRRSAEHDSRNQNGELKYTSIILDAYK